MTTSQRMFRVPDDWLPIPWSVDDLRDQRRCASQQPYDKNPVTCGRGTGHDGVCIGLRSVSGVREYWA